MPKAHILRDLFIKLFSAFFFVVATSLASRGDETTLKMVVTAAFVSDAGIDVYDDIAAYLSEKTGYKIEVVSGLSYAQANEALESGKVEIGAICGLPYIHKLKEGHVELLAMPAMSSVKGSWPDVPGYGGLPGKYFSYTIVKKDSPIRNWLELRGKSYVFNDMDSNSGYNMPRYKLIQLGAKSWDDYFSKVRVSGSHEESIRMVAEGLVDASSVDSLVLDFDRSNNDAYASKVQVIEVLFKGGAGAPPFVISTKANIAFKKPVQDAMVSMHLDPKGKKILERALLQEFMKPDDANYDDIRRWESEAKRVDFRDFSATN